MSEEKKKRKNPSGVNTHEDTDANGELDSPAADEPAANEGTSSPAPPPISESSEIQGQNVRGEEEKEVVQG